MDIAKLIATGKITKDVKIGPWLFSLESPTFNDPPVLGQGTTEPDGLSVVVSCIKKVRNADAKTEDVYDTPEQRKVLRDVLDQAQGGLVSMLQQACLDLAKEQETLLKN